MNAIPKLTIGQRALKRFRKIMGSTDPIIEFTYLLEFGSDE